MNKRLESGSNDKFLLFLLLPTVISFSLASIARINAVVSAPKGRVGLICAAYAWWIRGSLHAYLAPECVRLRVYLPRGHILDRITVRACITLVIYSSPLLLIDRLERNVDPCAGNIYTDFRAPDCFHLIEVKTATSNHRTICVIWQGLPRTYQNTMCSANRQISASVNFALPLHLEHSEAFTGMWK